MPFQIFSPNQGLLCIFRPMATISYLQSDYKSAIYCREKTGAPVINRYVRNATVFVDSSWIQDLTRFFNNIRLNRVLCNCVVDVVLNKVYFNLFFVHRNSLRSKGKVLMR